MRALRVNEANPQLSDKDNYKQLPNDRTLQHNTMVNNVIERFQGEKECRPVLLS